MAEVYSRYQQPCPGINNKSNMRCVLNFSASLKRLYGVKLNGRKLEILDNGIILPRDYFFPKHYLTKEIKITKNSIAIHHYGATWHSKGKIIGAKIASSLVHLFGEQMFGICFERIARVNMLGQLKREYKKRIPLKGEINEKH